jgi:hypothetical protein
VLSVWIGDSVTSCVYKCSINPVTNPNPVCSHSIKSWQYIYHYIQCLVDIVVSFYYIRFIQIQGHLVCWKPLLTWERTFFDGMQKSCKLLWEIMTLVPSANIIIIAEVFSVGGRSVNRLWKAKALKLTPGGLHSDCDIPATKGNVKEISVLEFSRGRIEEFCQLWGLFECRVLLRIGEV